MQEMRSRLSFESAYRGLRGSTALLSPVVTHLTDEDYAGCEWLDGG